MRWCAIAVCVVWAGADAGGQPPGRLDLEPGELQPGLVAEYHSIAEPKSMLSRIEAKPAFHLGRSSPHPRLPSGPFEVHWTSVLALKEPGPLTFSAFAGGELTIQVDGETVLDGRGNTETAKLVGKQSLKREPGSYRISIRFRSLADVPARLQIWWEAPSFAAEPIPAWRFGHLAADETPSVKNDVLAETGRRDPAKLGCARCHASAFPSATDPPPGPSLADANRRLSKSWILDWLENPAKMRPDSHMPALFAPDRGGSVERWLIAEQLGAARPPADTTKGDHRRGRLAFLGFGCAACHLVPELPRAEQKPLDRVSLSTIGERLSASDIAAFLGNPHSRYPDGRMPRLPVTPEEARDIAAYLLMWSKPAPESVPPPPTGEELQQSLKRLGVPNQAAAATKLLSEKGCTSCHTGLGESKPRDVPLVKYDGGCMSEKGSVRFAMPAEVKQSLTAFVAVAAAEKHPSPVFERQRKLERAGCVRCHQRDGDRPPPLEEVGSTLGGAFLQELPFLRGPRLTHPHQKFTRTHLTTAVREGVSGIRWSRFSYRMPAFGADSDVLLQALAEADGELLTEAEPPAPPIADPTLGTVHGPQLAGTQGYGCASCHVWNGRLLGSPDPVATGPDLTRTAGRIRRDWFDRYLESPMRFHPGTPMPAVFERGKPASLGHILNGDPAKQKDALWAYFARGKDAPSPAPPPPVPIDAPATDEPLIAAQIPIRLPDGRAVESLTLLTADHDLLVYDLGEGVPLALFTGGRILRNVQGRIRQFHAAGTPVELKSKPTWQLAGIKKPREMLFLGYERLADGVKLHWSVDSVPIDETVRFDKRRLVREVRLIFERIDLPPAKAASKWEAKPLTFADAVEGSLERPGYKAFAYPRPKTISGEDRVMPGAVAVRPKDGQVFVASLKTGELFTLKNNAFELYSRGLYQDALSMLAEDDGLYVLHRRNLTKITGDGDRFERVATLPHGIADTYDMAYGLARDNENRFVFGYAAYSNGAMPGAGGVLRLTPGKPPIEAAYGLRNALGWCRGPDGETFFTDNQGDWVAANKLCHIEDGKFYGWPNAAQKQHNSKPAGKAAVWVPYGWARSINGVAYDSTGGKFGPFAGQFFMAELMYGGAIIRANVEKVNGVYQGACFPFWGKGLLGPVTLAFDPRGKLYVGGITEPGWMAQPDRGALYRIDFTGSVPFEMQSIHVEKSGFRIAFTKPANAAKAADRAAYRIESYRYEYTGSYGSPELDRAALNVEKVEVSADGLSATLHTAALAKDRVYLIIAAGVRSTQDEPLVYPTGAYTLHEIPK